MNRVLLNAPYHQGLHTDDYMNHIENGVEDAWDSNGKQGVEDFLEDMTCQQSSTFDLGRFRSFLGLFPISRASKMAHISGQTNSGSA